MSYQLDKNVADKLKDFFSKFDFIDKVVIFGSRAKHNANPKSDIDLCIYSLEMDKKEFTKLKLKLDELPILYKMDVVHFENSNDELKENILRDGKLFFVKELPFNEFFKNTSPKPYQIEKKDYLESGKYPVVDQGKKFIVGYSNQEEKLFKLNNSIIIFGDHTRIIKYVDFDFIIGADGTKILFPYDDSIDAKYAYYQLLYTKIENLGYSRHYKLLKEKSFQKPSLTKQKQIAKTLNKAKELIELRKESINKLDELSKSIFIDMFGDPVNNPKKLKKQKLSKIAKIQTGNTPPRKDLDNYGNYIEWIKSDNILKEKYNMSEAKEYLSKKGYSKGRIVPVNSLLVTCIAGSMSSIGNVNIVNREVAFNQQINSITPFTDNIYYLYYAVKLSKKYIEENSSKSMKIMINKTKFENLEFIIPDIKLQEKFASIIQKAEQQKSLYQEELTKLQESFDALLTQSFKAQ